MHAQRNGIVHVNCPASAEEWFISEQELLLKRFCEDSPIAMLAKALAFWSASAIRNRRLKVLTRLHTIYNISARSAKSTRRSSPDGAP